MNTITAYYRFGVLAENVRLLNGIRSSTRLDCTGVHNPANHGLLPVFQRKNGMLFLYLIPAREMVKADSKRRATYTLGDGKMNLSSLYFERPDFNQYCYGYPNGKALLSDKTPNPTAPYKHDAFLFVCDWQQNVIEVLVIQGGKAMIENLYNLLIDGEFDEEIKRFRELAGPYYDYKTA